MLSIFSDLQCLMRFGHAFMHYTTLSMMQAILLLKNSSILRATACQGNTYMVYSRYNRDLYDIADYQASYKYA